MTSCAESSPRRASPRWLAAAGVAMLASVPLSFLGAPYPRELVLQHVPTLAILAGWMLMVRRRTLSPGSLACLLAFVGLHVVGARWIYSFVPYDDVCEALTGGRLSDWFGWRRNHYDRFVHFAFGVLVAPPAAEFFRERWGLASGRAAALAVIVVAALGGFYETAEWLVAVAFSPEQAEAYNGQQGDAWDAQKDMALNVLGALVVAPCAARGGRRAASNDAPGSESPRSTTDR